MESLITQLHHALRGRPGIELVLLFGSRARGQAHQHSDVDLAVLGQSVDILELIRDLSLVAGRDVDVVDLKHAGYPLLQAVLRDGQLVYEGRRGALGRWRSRTIAELENDRPQFERMRNAFLKGLAEGKFANG